MDESSTPSSIFTRTNEERVLLLFLLPRYLPHPFRFHQRMFTSPFPSSVKINSGWPNRIIRFIMRHNLMRLVWIVLVFTPPRWKPCKRINNRHPRCWHFVISLSVWSNQQLFILLIHPMSYKQTMHTNSFRYFASPFRGALALFFSNMTTTDDVVVVVVGGRSGEHLPEIVSKYTTRTFRL